MDCATMTNWPAVHIAADARRKLRPLRHTEPERAPPRRERITAVEWAVIAGVVLAIAVWLAS